MTARLPDANTLDRRAALRAFWAERRKLARAARVGLDFTGAVHPPRAVEEREWLVQQARLGGPSAERESDETLATPPGPRHRTR